MINWRLSDNDHRLIVEIAQRVEREIARYPDNRRTLIMDLTACHANGCALDLAGLLVAPLIDFSHDILEIRRHIDRRTGTLVGCFLPRYAQANSEVNG